MVRALTAKVFLGHLAMTDLPRLQELDHVMWSLVVEARISLIFPILALCVQRQWAATLAASVAISALALGGHHFLHVALPYDPFATLQYFYLFAAGAVLALKAHELSQIVNRSPLAVRVALWVGALAFFTYPANRHFGLFVCGGACTALVTLCFADRRTDQWLSAPVPVWLGRVSYRLFLVHVPVLLFMVHMFNGRLPLLGLIAMSTVISFAVAELGYRFVEVPTTALGRSLARRRLPVAREPSLRLAKEGSVEGA